MLFATRVLMAASLAAVMVMLGKGSAPGPVNVRDNSLMRRAAMACPAMAFQSPRMVRRAGKEITPSASRAFDRPRASRRSGDPPASRDVNGPAMVGVTSKRSSLPDAVTVQFGAPTPAPATNAATVLNV